MSVSTRSYPKGAARRAEIVAVATQNFARSGFEGTSILEIAGDVGISRAGLLHHFASKEELLTAVLDERERADRQVFLDNGSAHSGGWGVLRGMVRLAELNESRPAMVRLFVVLSAEATEPSHPSHDYFQHHFARVLHGTEQALIHLRQAGMLRPEVEPSAFSRDLIALQDGLQLQWLMRPGQTRIAKPLENRISSALVQPLWGEARERPLAPAVR